MNLFMRLGGTVRPGPPHEQIHHAGHLPRDESVHELGGDRKAGHFHEQIHHVGHPPRDESVRGEDEAH